MNEKIARNSRFDTMFEQAFIKYVDDGLDKIPPREELEKIYTFSDRHNARMERLFAWDKRRDIWKAAFVWGKRAAACVTITVTIAFAVLMANPTVYAAVQGTVIEWFDQFTRYSMKTEQPAPPLNMADNVWYPTYLPEGFSETAATVDSDIATAIYANEGGGVITLIYASVIGSASVNNEGVAHAEKMVNGIKYDLYVAYEENKSNSIVWENGGVRFQLVSDIQMAELLKIAQSFVQK
jgi:hypothetical protein